MTKDMINAWLERNDEAMDKAATILAVAIIENIICDPDKLKDEVMLRNATDLAECSEHDICQLYSLLNERWELSRDYDYTYGKLESGPYSIKEWNRKERGHGGVKDLFINWCEENYDEVLPEQLLREVRERRDVACVVNAFAYGGGGYEVMQDLYHAAKVKVAETVKKQFSDN